MCQFFHATLVWTTLILIKTFQDYQTQIPPLCEWHLRCTWGCWRPRPTSGMVKYIKQNMNKCIYITWYKCLIIWPILKFYYILFLNPPFWCDQEYPDFLFYPNRLRAFDMCSSKGFNTLPCNYWCTSMYIYCFFNLLRNIYLLIVIYYYLAVAVNVHSNLNFLAVWCCLVVFVTMTIKYFELWSRSKTKLDYVI